MASTYRRLGEVLVAQGSLTSLQLAIALADQQVTNRKLGEIVVDRGFASEDEVARCLAEQYNYPLVDLATDPHPDALAMLTADQAVTMQALPLQFREGSIVVAIADPLDLETTDTLMALTEGRAKIAIAPAKALQVMIESCYGLSAGLQITMFPEAASLPDRFHGHAVRSRFGRATVLDATDIHLHREVTLVSVPDEDWNGSHFEAAVHAAAKGSDGVVPVFDCFAHEGRQWVVLEQLVGENLETILRTRGPRQLAQSAHIVSMVSEIANAMERRGIEASWCCPRNVLITPTGAKLVACAEPTYLAREEVTIGEANVLALGNLLEACLYGVNGEAPPDIPPAMEEVLDRCLAPNRKHRYSSAVQVAMALRAFAWSSISATPSIAVNEDRERLLDTVSHLESSKPSGFWSRLFGRRAA